MNCNRQVRGQHVYDETIYIEEFKKEILETIYSGRVQLREDDVVIATYPKSGKFHGALWELWSYPGYFWEPYWFSVGLPEIST